MEYVPIEELDDPVQEQWEKPTKKSRYTPRRTNAPSTQIVDHLRLLFRKRYNRDIRLPVQELKKQYKLASDLLERVDGDIELLKKALELQFLDPRFAWADRFQLSQCFHDLQKAVMIVQETRDAQQKEIERRKAVDRLLAREEDVWSTL